MEIVNETFLSLSVCCKKTDDLKDVQIWANTKRPSGTSGGWGLAKQEDLADGVKCVVQCSDHEDSHHVLFVPMCKLGCDVEDE